MNFQLRKQTWACLIAQTFARGREQLTKTKTWAAAVTVCCSYNQAAAKRT
jgi:hypothetical protein